MKNKNVRLPLLFFTVATFAGCAWYPIDRTYMREAAQNVTVPMVQNELKKYDSAIVIWGGIVLSDINDSSGSNLVIMETSLDDAGYPMEANLPRGRFIARTRLFLDPEIYRKGRRVTLAGQVTGLSTRKMGDGTYAYPILDIKELRYWRYYQEYYDEPYYPYYGPWWYSDFGARFFFGFDEHGHHLKRGYLDKDRRGHGH